MSWYTKTTKAKGRILKQQNLCALKIQLNIPPFSSHIFLNQRLSFYSDLKKIYNLGLLTIERFLLLMKYFILFYIC